MGGHRQRTVLNEPEHTRHLRGRDPTEGPGLVHIGQIPTPPTRHTPTPPHEQLPHGTARAQANTQLTADLSHNHLLTQFFIILREVTTKWFT